MTRAQHYADLIEKPKFKLLQTQLFANLNINILVMAVGRVDGTVKYNLII